MLGGVDLRFLFLASHNNHGLCDEVDRHCYKDNTGLLVAYHRAMLYVLNQLAGGRSFMGIRYGD